MLKISQAPTASQSVTLKLEGRVVGPWVAELLQFTGPLLAGGQSLKLDLTDVSFADAAGVSALSNLKARGVAVTNCSPFMEQRLKSQ